MRAPVSRSRPLLKLSPLLVGLAAFVLAPGGAAARARRPHCGARVRVLRGYTVHLHKRHTSGVFGIYLLAPERFVAPHGSVCVNVIARHHLPLVPAGSGMIGSRMEIVHDHRTIFPNFGGRPVLADTGAVITLATAGTLAAIEHCPRCFKLQVWPLGYRGRKPELSASL